MNRKRDITQLVGAEPTCPLCGSTQIHRDAIATWSKADRCWELSNTYDHVTCGECEAEITPEWIIDEPYRRSQIRTQNDKLRQGQPMGHASIVLTQGIMSFGRETIDEIKTKIASFVAFDEDNDPHHEHDFGAFSYEGHKIFFKIDPFDLRLKALSPDQADPKCTHRVMTIMLAEEY